MFGWLKNIRGNDTQRRTVRTVHVPLRVRGRYDAAATTDENRRHWANADLLSANAANNPAGPPHAPQPGPLRGGQQQLRPRDRARRWPTTRSAPARGCRCSPTTPRPTALIEQEFMRWAEAIGLPEKLRTMRMARAESGEAFCMLVANPQVDSPVKLDLRLIEADQVATPDLARQSIGANAVDGIVFDAYGNPIEYHVLKNHPGDGVAAVLAGLTTASRPRR